jgi:hypothetical protein
VVLTLETPPLRVVDLEEVRRGWQGDGLTSKEGGFLGNRLFNRKRSSSRMDGRRSGGGGCLGRKRTGRWLVAALSPSTGVQMCNPFLFLNNEFSLPASKIKRILFYSN